MNEIRDAFRRIGLAIRALWLVLFVAGAAEPVERALHEMGKPAVAEEKPKPAPRPKPAAVRSEAVTLLATLQREARFVDFIQEPLTGYSDAQVGAAARDVHRDCAAVIERMFALEPLAEEAEGAEIEVPAGFDTGRFRLVGNVAGEPPFRGRLVHHGWEASKCEVPAWSGSEGALRVVAPGEVELK